MSYFDGMRVGLYRQTFDGRRVCARRSIFPWRKRWYYILPGQESKYEKRTVGVQLTSFGIMIVLVVTFGDRLLADPRWFAGLLVATLLPGFLYRTTSGLEPASIDPRSLVPRNTNALSLGVARATGAPTLWFLLAASALMAAGQLYVILTDGAWWSWAGLVIFAVSGIGTVRQLLLLRKSDPIAPAS
jgi:hypothetical protein